MALITLDITRNYGNGKKWIQAYMDTVCDNIEAQHVYDNYNFTQFALDAFGSGVYSFDNDGLANYTNNLYNKQSLSSSDTGDTIIAVVGAWTDVDASNSILTQTPEIAGDFLNLCTFMVQALSSNNACEVDVMFRLTDGTTNSNPARYRRVNMVNTQEDITPVTLFHEFSSWTATSKSVKLQYYITTLTNITLTVAASATAPTSLHGEKI